MAALDGESSGAAGTAGAPDTTLDGRVYEKLVDRIRSGAVGFGERLPSEMELAADFGVSRPVVRTALARLRDDGLIVSRRGAGSFVYDGGFAPSDGYSPFHSIDDITRWYRFRCIVEAESAAQAARDPRPAAIAELCRICDKVEETPPLGAYKVEEDLRFHLAVAQMADNRFIVETLRMLKPHLTFVARFVRTLGHSGPLDRQRQFAAEHRTLVAAIEARDPDAARTAMVSHIMASQRRVFEGELD